MPSSAPSFAYGFRTKKPQMSKPIVPFFKKNSDNFNYLLHTIKNPHIFEKKNNNAFWAVVVILQNLWEIKTRAMHVARTKN